MARDGLAGGGLAPLPRPEDTGTLTAQVREALEDAIAEGRIAPGTRLNSDDIATAAGVDRVPVREALRALHEDGWVAIRARDGMYVGEHSRRELDELFEARAVVEAAIARWAAERATDDDRRALEEAVARGREAARDRRGSEVELQGRRFAAALRAAARNSVLAGTAAGLERRARFYAAAAGDGLDDDWVEVHEEMAGLVRARDGRRAGEVAAEQVRDTGRAVAHLLRLGGPAGARA